MGGGRKDMESCGVEVLLVVAILSCWCCFLHLNESGVDHGVLFEFV